MKREREDSSNAIRHADLVEEELAEYSDQFLEKPLILVIDDSAMNRELLTEILQSEYRVLEACDGEEGLDKIDELGDEISAVLLDIIMPGVNGFAVLEALNNDAQNVELPVIMISSESDPSVIRTAFDLGATDYISRPFDSYIVHKRVSNAVRLYAKQRGLKRLAYRQFYERDKYNTMLVDILGQVVESHNGESNQHVRNIHVITKLLLDSFAHKHDEYHLSPSRRTLIAITSALHDIGKIAIDGAILNKPGRLTNEEYEEMKTHAVIGAGMIDALDQYKDEELTKVAYEICRWHHERYDGRGYPDGLTGDQIPISAQVVGVADVYDALTSKRVYKDAYSHEKAIEMILDNQCGVFNPQLIECLVEIQYDIADAVGVKHE